MSGDRFLDNAIRSALAFDEDRLDIDYGPLRAAKKRLDDDRLVRRIDMRNIFMGKLKVSLILALIFIIAGGVLGVNALQRMRTDKIDYPFVNDPEVIGKWESVDFVHSKDEFVPGKRHVQEELYLKEAAFVKDGKLLASLSEGNGVLAETDGIDWTKGYIINRNDIAANGYEIRRIDGSNYLFMQWKTGDYIYHGMNPYYYVLKQVDSSDYSGYEYTARKTDNIDYPFSEDPQAIGKWQCVDCVKTIDSFDPQNKYWLADLYYLTLDFKKGGKLTKVRTGKGSEEILKWTEGLILDSVNKTASEYSIKEIDGETYMFYGWKNDDYTIRGIDPYYLVLKRCK